MAPSDESFDDDDDDYINVDGYYDDEDNYDIDDNDEEEEDNYEVEELEDKTTQTKEETEYRVLDEAKFLNLIEEEILTINYSLSLAGPSSAATLLRYYNWNIDMIVNDWFDGKESLHAVVAMLEKSTSIAPPPTTTTVCKICYEEFNLSSMSTASCSKHYFCNACWAEYMRVMVDNGPACLYLRCPEPSCQALITDETIQQLAAADDYLKYNRQKFRTLAQTLRSLKWCPIPDCQYAIQIISANHGDVICCCGHSFCWGCVEETHRPVSCAIVAMWQLQNQSEAENINWIISYTKPCPKCKNSIHKNGGCMHMKCMCGHHFCWLCLASWEGHRDYYSCNRYQEMRSKGEFSEQDKKIEMARDYIERYSHYYTRWIENGASTVKAVESLREMELKQKDMLMSKHEQTAGQMTAFTEAWAQIVECRRFLRWTYVYGYYMSSKDIVKVEMFENLQGFAQLALEKLHHCAENEVKEFVDAPSSMKDEFVSYRQKLAQLTDCAKTYFNNLTQELEKDLI